MKKYSFLAILALVFWVFSASVALGDETKVFKFRMQTVDSVASSNIYPDSDYEVSVSNGKCEATLAINGTPYLASKYATAELCRLVGVDQEKRMYVNPPHSVGQTWDQTYVYENTRGKKDSRTVKYTVVSKTGDISTIRGEATGYFPGGSYDLLWVYDYDESRGFIVKWFWDTAVGQKGAKRTIKLIE